MRRAMRNDKPPNGRLTGSFEELFAEGCIQTGCDVHKTAKEAEGNFLMLFNALMLSTNGNMCDGCPMYEGGTCKAFRKFHSGSPHRQKATKPEITVITRKRCPDCGLKIRGDNHDAHCKGKKEGK